MPKIVEQHIVDVIGMDDPDQILRNIEHCGRIAYASWDRESQISSTKFVQMIVHMGHESVLEHHSITVILVCDRATAQQFTRHRIASFTMQSQRYCNYTMDRFNREITFVHPDFIIESDENRREAHAAWERHVGECESAYTRLMELGCSPEDARSALPNSTACTVAITANLREWRHILKLRTDIHAQHNIRHLAQDILDKMKTSLPSIFSDI